MLSEDAKARYETVTPWLTPCPLSACCSGILPLLKSRQVGCGPHRGWCLAVVLYTLTKCAQLTPLLLLLPCSHNIPGVDELTRNVVDILDFEGLKKVCVVGHSYGSFLASRFNMCYRWVGTCAPLPPGYVSGRQGTGDTLLV